MADAWGSQDTNGTDTTNGGFGASNDAFGTSDAFAEGDVTQEEAGRIQEDKINKKKLAELEDDGKMLQIFVRPSKKSGHIPYTGVKGIPLGVALICSNLLFEKLKKKGQQYYIIEDDNLAPYNFIFNWMKQCGDERGVANLPEIKDDAKPENGLKPFIDIMLVAEKLKIPTASFNKFMLKKMTPLARDYLIDLPTVSRIFDSGDSDMYDLGLQEIAATSIFSHWYDYKLDAPEYDDYMCELSEMRDNIPELDDALHKAVSDKDAWLKNKRQERREKQAAEEAAGDGGGWGAPDGGNADAGFAETPSFGGGGDESWTNQGVAASTDDWVNQVTTTTNEWDKNGVAPEATPSWAVDDAPLTSGGDWADEMNGSVEPVPAVTSGGGW